MSHFHKLWKIHTINAILWHNKMIVMLHRSFWYLICMIWDILSHITPEYVLLPESRTPKTQIRWFLKIWQEPGLGTKLKICAKGYRPINKHNIEGTFHGQIQPISWRTNGDSTGCASGGKLTTNSECLARNSLLQKMYQHWISTTLSHIIILKSELDHSHD